MDAADIPIISSDDSAPDRSVGLREQAPHYLQSLLDDSRTLGFIGNLEDLRPEQFIPLGGGKDAATYLIRHQGRAVIVKFGRSGLGAEAEALQAWIKRHVHVPEVLAQGSVPTTNEQGETILFLVEDAQVDKYGRLNETCENFLRHSPESALHVGELMGKELAKLHSTTSKRTFGDYADTDGNTAPYTSWNAYLTSYFRLKANYLEKHGIGRKQLDAVEKYIENSTFVPTGRYLHGDFSIRNCTFDPYSDRLTVFDPNPVIGDPSWDIAVLYNNVDYYKRQAEQDRRFRPLARRDEQLLSGFRKGYGRSISERNVLSARIVQGILHSQYNEGKAGQGNKPELVFKSRLQVLLELVRQVSKGEAPDDRV